MLNRFGLLRGSRWAAAGLVKELLDIDLSQIDASHPSEGITASLMSCVAGCVNKDSFV